MDGVTDRRGHFIVTPDEALNRYGVETAHRLLTETPKHFQPQPGDSYFVFLQMSYSPVPDWAIIHRAAGPIFVDEDLVPHRPGENVIMMATVAGPIIQLHPAEIRLWEDVSTRLSRAFQVVEMEDDGSH